MTPGSARNSIGRSSPASDGPDVDEDGLDNFLADWIHVDRDKLVRATEQVQILADWLQEQIYAR